MSIKITFTMIVFNGDYVLKENLESIYPFAEKIIITEGPVKHYQELGYVCSTDETINIIKNFNDPENKIQLIQGVWNGKDHMCDVQSPYFAGDFVWHVDSDEFYTQTDMEKVVKYLNDNDNCYSMAFKLKSFYGGFDRYISGFEENFEVHRIQRIIPGKSKWSTHRPPTMIWPPTEKSCREMGHVDFHTTDNWGIRIYHYSHVFPKQVKAKMEYYYHRDPRGIIPDYWNSLYVPWIKAKTEEEKLKIEQPTKGVQEWIPQRRGDAYTKKFNGKHPETIENMRPELEKRIKEELKELEIK